MKITCTCGHQITDGTDNLPNKAHILPDRDLFTLLDAIDAAIAKGGRRTEERLAMETRSLFTKLTRRAWQCNACGRLWLENASYDLVCFAPEDREAARDVLSDARS